MLGLPTMSKKGIIITNQNNNKNNMFNEIIKNIQEKECLFAKDAANLETIKVVLSADEKRNELLDFIFEFSGEEYEHTDKVWELARKTSMEILALAENVLDYYKELGDEEMLDIVSKSYDSIFNQ